jgi:cellobiose-specific phosphotransferase system component IIC
MRHLSSPTALGIVSFCVPLTIASMALMRFGTLELTATWAAVGPYTVRLRAKLRAASADTRCPQFIGGMGMLLAAIFEIIAGNSFAFVVFASFSGEPCSRLRIAHAPLAPTTELRPLRRHA